MTVFLCIAFPALAVCVVAALYPELVTKPFAGTGKRRKQSPAELAKANAELKRELAEAKQAKPCPNCHHVADGVMPTNAEIAESDRTDPAPHINAPAPVDNGSRDTPLANAETQPVDVRDLRDALGEGDTVTLPAVAPITPVVPLHEAPLPPVTWGTNPKALEDWATGTAPGPMHEVPVGLGSKASVKVHAVLEEAS